MLILYVLLTILSISLFIFVDYDFSSMGSVPGPTSVKRRTSMSKRYRDDRRMRSFLAWRCRASTEDSVSTPPFAHEQRVGFVDIPPSYSAPVSSSTPIPTSIVSLLTHFYDMVVNDSSTFGAYCRVWLSGSFDDKRGGRNRDIFPLPLMTNVFLSPTCDIDVSVVLNTCNLGILALNFLWDDCPSVAKPPSLGPITAAQANVHTHVQSSVLRLVERLLNVSARPRTVNMGPANPDLVAAKVEMGPVACTCDAMNFVSDSLRDQVISNGGLFREAGAHRKAVPRFSGKDRSEYLKVTVRGLQSGKLRLKMKVSGGGSIFTVGKPSGGQREVWHGRYVSSVAPVPPKPRHQPTPSCLLDLEAGPSRPLYFSKRDAVSYFDSLVAPECVRDWFGRPSIMVHELLSILGSDSLDAVSGYIDIPHGSKVSHDTRLYPVACCWPMGFSWSSAVAQDTMLSQITAIGLDGRHLLADDKPAPNGNEVDEYCAVCTDDVMHWSRSVTAACLRLASLDVQWGKSGIIRKPAKDIDWSLRGTAIGCDFDGEAGFLDPNASKQIQILYDTVVLLSSTEAKPEDVMTIMGSLQWFDLLARSKLAVYHKVYDFERLPNSGSTRILPREVRSELQMSIALSLFWSANLDRPFLPIVSATDASTTFGFGVSVAPAGEALVREISTYAEKRGDYVVLDRDPAGEKKPPKRRLGVPRHLNLDPNSFKTILSVKARHGAHSNVLEAEAFLLWFRWLLRSAQRHSVRAVCLVDSKVVLGGVNKGRSSSLPILRVLRRIAALQLAGDLLLRLVYIPTECNPADAPSRGVRPRPASRHVRNKCKDEKLEAKRTRYHQRLRNEIERSFCRDELNALVSDDPLFWEFRAKKRYYK